MPDLLFELGSEELPARFIPSALEELERLFRAECERVRVPVGTVTRFGTPRRLALLVRDLPAASADQKREVMGPAVRAAIGPNGEWLIPAEKFAKSQNVPVEKLIRVATPKGEYIAASVEEQGKPLLELLPEVLANCAKRLPFPKSMRWGDVEQTFARPLQWIVALLDSQVVPFVVADVQSGATTRGHRFLAPAEIRLSSPGEYEVALEKAHVIASIDRRRTLLQERLQARAKAAGTALVTDEALLEEVTNLVELPFPVVGEFDRRDLELPREVLIQEMKSHQRYFALTGADGALAPRFIAVSNTAVQDEKLCIRGYARVLRARLSDARYFFEEDRKTRLEARLPKLGKRQWVQSLGSMAEKTERIGALATWLAKAAGKSALVPAVERAAMLCKCDLETAMVGEFPELQGVMGREYARLQQEEPAVCLAISEHYLPRSAADALPSEDAGAFVGLADRLDSLCGLFAIGKKPTGAKDEYASRRGAIAVINIVLAKRYRFSLGAALDEALDGLKTRLASAKSAAASAVKEQVLEFIRERLRTLWSDVAAADQVEAVLAAGIDDIVAAEGRLRGLAKYVQRPEFASLAATFKRVANIVTKQARDLAPGAVNDALLAEPEEKALAKAAAEARESVTAHVAKDDYEQALGTLLPLGRVVDAFFDKVLVMDENPAIRENRLRLVRAVASLFENIADFSKIQTAGPQG